MTTTAQTDFKSLPIVDINGLFSEDYEQRKLVAKELGKAARDVGFLYIKGHNIDPVKINNLKNIAKEYFAQDYDKKMKDYIGNSSNHSGYVPEGEEIFYGGKKDKKEGYDVNIDFTEGKQIHPLVGANQWPENEKFKLFVKDYYSEILALGKVLLRGFAMALNIDENSFDKFITNPPSQLRLLHYPANHDEQSTQQGIGAHTDYECFTILLPTAPGLEVLNGAGEWIDAPLIEDAFVINIGDMLEVLSNGNLIATSHRVRKVTEERYSFPLFFSCDYETIIKPLEGVQPRFKDKKYEQLSCGDHLYAQTINTFKYLKDKLKNGEITLPDGSKDIAHFGEFKYK
ncbi:hypothetical protein KO488_13805 [Poseidonibacter lekithochrous]|uniref:isopenicillin N synthase family dioxygenase n=1 Tax=Poseidonibacter TaxID=2321187 RepID=UPI001C0A1954|nr:MULTISPECIES: 2-oxoglutarate and iron-dependent oxygenase domain-containing protein [Poseidonibacter]MBU3015837.1 hypothetical protein [Poseidonibacter lekithochrous]MDO6829136.1 2-oxoglutarate and iron-dependent oxygenase domain-containing protein [Poseidonibacter sp. 1_MG-2023]